MRNLPGVCCLLVVVYSCHTKGPAFRITNKSGQQLDSVFMEPNALPGTKYLTLAPGESRLYTCDMQTVSGDGIFFIHYKRTGKHFRFPGDYFSNGNAMPEISSGIDIFADTINIRFSR